MSGPRSRRKSSILIVVDTTQSIILQCGDSWSVGVYNSHHDGPHFNGSVGQKFIELGYGVRNLGQPGISNLEAITRLEAYSSANPFDLAATKFILFWQTKFPREMLYYLAHDQDSLPPELVSNQGYHVVKDSWIYRPYHRLAKICEKWQVPIYVLGGFGDTVWYDEFKKDFPGVKIICQSVTQLLLTGNHRVSEPVFCPFVPLWINRGQFLDRMKRGITNQDLEMLLHDMDLGAKRMRLWQQNPHLFPDHYHPNCQGHSIIFAYLLQNVPELAVDKKKPNIIIL